MSIQLLGGAIWRLFGKIMAKRYKEKIIRNVTRVLVGRSGSLWGRSGSLWVVVDHCATLTLTLTKLIKKSKKKQL
jgi:hypothetical protein